MEPIGGLFIMTKFCKECKTILPLDSFTKSKNVKDGYENKCKKCRQEARRKHIKYCEHCSKIFKSAKKNAKYCSSKCAGDARNTRVKTTCDYCNSDIEVKQYLIRDFKYQYCNRDCRTEHLRKIMLGENNPNFQSSYVKCDGCDKNIKVIPSLKDKYNFCSFDCYKENIGQYYSGVNSSNWNHDLTKEERIVGRKYPAYYKWRRNVFEKDNYTCQCCGDDKGGNLEAHHILNYTEHPKLRVDISNGITLCEVCHKRFQDINGYTRNTAKQLNEYIKTQASM